MANHLLVLFSLVTIAACSPKPQNSDTTESSTNSSDRSSSTVAALPYDSTRNPFGVLTNSQGSVGALSPAVRIKLAKAMGVNYVRTAVVLSNWSGSVPANDAFINAGLKMVMNINNTPSGRNNAVTDYPSDMVSYKRSLNSVFDKYQPEVVVIENEEANSNYHSGSAAEYITMLTTAIDAAHARGLRVTNGGLTSRELTLLTWKDFMNRGMTREANEFGKSAIPPEYLDDLPGLTRHKQMAERLRKIDSLIKAYKNLPLDYVNFHWYEPINLRGLTSFPANADFEHVVPGAMEAVVNFLHNATGKTIMTNEFGPVTESPNLVKELMQEVLNLKLPYALIYSGDGDRTGKAIPLHTDEGSLKANGIAFKDFISSHFKQ